MAPAFGYQVTDKFSVGLALNIVYGLFNLRQQVVQDINGDKVPEFFQFVEESDDYGFGATF